MNYAGCRCVDRRGSRPRYHLGQFFSIILLTILFLVPSRLKGVVVRPAVAVDARAIYVCIHPIDAASDIRCVTLGALSRAYDWRALQLVQAFEDQAQRYAGTSTPPALSSQFIDSWLRRSWHLGCAGKGGRQAAVYLSLSAVKRAPLRAGRSAEVVAACNTPQGRRTPDAAVQAAYTLFGADYDAANFEAAMQNYLQQCIGSSVNAGSPQSRARLILPAKGGTAKEIGKWLEKHLGGSPKPDKPSGGAGPGIRGYCLADDPCTEPSCQEEAEMKAFLDYLKAQEYTGCNINATPRPEGPDECAKPQLGRAVTAQEFQLIRGHVCKLLGSVASTSTETHFRCLDPASLRSSQFQRSQNPCDSPAALCTDDARAKAPQTRTGFVHHKVGPLPVYGFLPPSFQWEPPKNSAQGMRP